MDLKLLDLFLPQHWNKVAVSTSSPPLLVSSCIEWRGAFWKPHKLSVSSYSIVYHIPRCNIRKEFMSVVFCLGVHDHESPGLLFCRQAEHINNTSKTISEAKYNWKRHVDCGFLKQRIERRQRAKGGLDGPETLLKLIQPHTPFLEACIDTQHSVRELKTFKLQHQARNSSPWALCHLWAV